MALFEATQLGERIPVVIGERVEVHGMTILNPLHAGSNGGDLAWWIDRSGDGELTLLISIVDAGTFITQQTTPALEHEIRSRAFDQYTAEGVFLPMVPAALTEGTLSFVEGQRCPTVTLSLSLDASLLPVGEPSWQQTSVRTQKRWTYEEIEKVLTDEHAADAGMFQDALGAALSLWSSRVEQGGMRRMILRRDG